MRIYEKEKGVGHEDLHHQDAALSGKAADAAAHGGIDGSGME